MCDRVGIIEVGRLIAVGSVDEIHRRSGPAEADAKTEIKLRLLGSVTGIVEWLQQRPDVHDVRLEGELVRLASGR